MTKELTPEDVKKTISKKLEMLRKNSGQTNEAAADSLDIDLSEFYRILKGHRMPKLHTFLRISQKYGTKLDWWFSETQELPRGTKQFHKRAFEMRVMNLFQKLDAKFQEFVLNLIKDLVKKTVRPVV
jgi:transcriptional regulator with XRE-family HTH domain